MIKDFEDMTDEEYDLFVSEAHKLYEQHRDIVAKVLGEQIQDFQLEHVLLENISDLYEEQ